LHLFSGGNFTVDGTQPDSTPVIGSSGELFGTTYAGGIYNFGTVYELLPPAALGSAWTETNLYSFDAGSDGGDPNAVSLGSDGNLYGTTQIGGITKQGITNQGTVFQLLLPQSMKMHGTNTMSSDWVGQKTLR
jgi:uncharacterized repeat protein (TIGR03803 family)